MGQAKLDLVFKKQGLDKITEDLKKLKKIASEIDVGGDSKKEGVVNKRLEEREMLLKRIETAKRNNWRNVEKETEKLLQLNKDEKEVTTLMLKKVDTLIEKEKTRIKWAKTGKKVREDDLKIEQDILKVKERQAQAIKKAKKENQQKVLGQGYDLQSTQVRSMDKGLDKTHTKATNLLKQLNSGIPLTKNQLKYLGLIEKKELLIQNTLKERVSISNKLSKIKETTANKVEKQRKSEVELIKQQKYDLDKRSVGKEGEVYDKLKVKIRSYQDQLKKGKALSNDQVRSMKLMEVQSNKLAKATTSATSLIGTMYAAMQQYSLIARQFDKMVDTIVSLDEPIFNLGVVAGKTPEQIEMLKLELLETASAIPKTAQEIANSMDLIMRTGATYEEAVKIVDAGSKLAIASGEDLNFITETLAKTIVAFSLSADTSAESVDRFQSAVLNTPLSMEGLSNAMKNSASAFATLINFTKKSGDELETYKQNLLNLNVALTAQFAKQGKMYALYKPLFMLEVPKVA